MFENGPSTNGTKHSGAHQSKLYPMAKIHQYNRITHGKLLNLLVKDIILEMANDIALRAGIVYHNHLLHVRVE